MERIRETKTQELIRRLKYNKSEVFGLAIDVILILCAIFANVIAPNSPTPSPPELSNALKPGFWSEDGIEGMPLGADGLGRCVLSRILYGCLLYTSDAADEEDSVDLGGRRIIKKK